MSIITTVADAMVTTLNSAGLTDTPEVTRVWKAPRARVDSKKPKIYVLPADYSRQLATRSKSEKDIGIDLVVHKLVGTTTADIDSVMDLVDEVHEALEFGQFGGYTLYTFDVEEPFSLELLQNSNVFASLTTCRLKGVT